MTRKAKDVLGWIMIAYSMFVVSIPMIMLAVWIWVNVK